MEKREVIELIHTFWNAATQDYECQVVEFDGTFGYPMLAHKVSKWCKANNIKVLSRTGKIAREKTGLYPVSKYHHMWDISRIPYRMYNETD